jgi:hypothetical protein
MKLAIVLGILLSAALLLSSGSPVGSTAASASGPAASAPPGIGLGILGQSTAGSAALASLTVANVSAATAVSPSFWGVNVLANYPFNAGNASHLARTPASYVRFPGGALGEAFNYTSGLITRDNGHTYSATTSTSRFVTSCQSFGCHAILQLPAEIDQPATAAYYANYVVNTLHFQPAYWEIGNSVPGWIHFNVSWSQWGTQNGTPITPLGFAQLVGTYITAVRAVDPGALFLALGAGMGRPGYDQTWVTNLTLVDGHNLSGISIHSYTMGTGPVNPTWTGLLENLNGQYSLPAQVEADRSYITAACPSCALGVFVTEANAAQVGTFSPLTATFAGTLYDAADTTQGLNLGLTNLDWFCFSCNYSGSWEGSYNHGLTQYTLFEKMMTRLGNELLASTLTGPSTLYAAATYSSQGYALLFVNVNATQSVSINLQHAGFPLGGSAERDRWTNGTSGPGLAKITLANHLIIPAFTIEVITFP